MTITVFLISRSVLFYENYFTSICRPPFEKILIHVSAARLTRPWNSVWIKSRRRRHRRRRRRHRRRRGRPPGETRD